LFWRITASAPLYIGFVYPITGEVYLMKITRDRLREMIREEYLEACSANAVDADVNEDYQMVHIPSLMAAFERELESNVDEDEMLAETMDCSKCISNYLIALNRAVNASKGQLTKR